MTDNSKISIVVRHCASYLCEMSNVYAYFDGIRDLHWCFSHDSSRHCFLDYMGNHSRYWLRLAATSTSQLEPDHEPYFSATSPPYGARYISMLLRESKSTDGVSERNVLPQFSLFVLAIWIIADSWWLSQWRYLNHWKYRSLAFLVSLSLVLRFPFVRPSWASLFLFEIPLLSLLSSRYSILFGLLFREVFLHHPAGFQSQGETRTPRLTHADSGIHEHISSQIRRPRYVSVIMLITLCRTTPGEAKFVLSSLLSRMAK